MTKHKSVRNLLLVIFILVIIVFTWFLTSIYSQNFFNKDQAINIITKNLPIKGFYVAEQTDFETILYKVELDKKKTKIVSIPIKKEIPFRAALMPDGKSILYIDQHHNIAKIDLNTLESTVIRNAYPYDKSAPGSIKPSESITYNDINISPDGKKVAVYWAGWEWTSIALMDIDGSNFDRIQPKNANELSFNGFAWSPDSKKFAISCTNNQSANANGCLYIASTDKNSEGIQVLPVSDKPFPNRIKDAFDPQWSPDGSRIIFSYRTNNEISIVNSGDQTGIFLVNSDGTNFTSLTENKSQSLDPYWLDNQGIVYFSKANNAIQKLNLTNEINETLVSSNNIADIDSVPKDGKYMAYSTIVGGLNIMNVDNNSSIFSSASKCRFVGWVN